MIISNEIWIKIILSLALLINDAIQFTIAVKSIYEKVIQVLHMLINSLIIILKKNQ